MKVANMTSRRDFLEQLGRLTAGAVVLGATSACGVLNRSGGQSDGTVVVRSSGGVTEDAWRAAVWEPFTEETGIRVVPVVANSARIQAMVESGNVELDVLDVPELTAVVLQRQEALEELDLSRFSRTNVDDLYSTDHYVGEFVYSHVIGYNSEAFAEDQHPKDWRDFWDAQQFPGSRVMYDAAASPPNLEFALLADGVAVGELYPIDVDRAFDKLTEIRPHILQWAESGAIAIQMLAEKQVVLGTMANALIQNLANQGLPVAIEWNQAKRYMQVAAVPTDAPNRDNAYAFLDYALQPEVQARFGRLTSYGPVNQRAFDSLSDEDAAALPTVPEHVESSFVEDVEWWADNLDDVVARWQEWKQT
jgi:putative spermidine/putrescine transport system substrate-binding protein